MKSHYLRSVALPAALLGGQAMLAGQAVAAPPAPSVHSWNGFYIGLNAGVAAGSSKANTAVDCGVPALYPPAYFCDASGTGSGNAAGVNAAGSGTISNTGLTGGVQLGYNWQASNLIYGLETDFGAFKLRSQRRGSGAYVTDPAGIGGGFVGTPFFVSTSFNTDWLYTLRGRVGWIFPANLMAYATGGLALTKLKVSHSFNDNVAPGGFESASASETKTGWTVGGGLEWAVGRNWSIKGEYLHVNFGKVTATGTIINLGGAPVAYAQGLSTSFDLTANVGRLGVNYRF